MSEWLPSGTWVLDTILFSECRKPDMNTEVSSIKPVRIEIICLYLSL